VPLVGLLAGDREGQRRLRQPDDAARVESVGFLLCVQRAG
jgi:hypothetical protein